MWTRHGYAVWIMSEYLCTLVSLSVAHIPEIDSTFLGLGDLVDYYDVD